jgi:hypothetical protein
LAGNGRRVPQLSLADSQRVFFFTMVHFDLPAVEADLKKSDYEQTQKPFSSTALPSPGCW